LTLLVAHDRRIARCRNLKENRTWTDLRAHAQVLARLVKRKAEAFTRRRLVATGLKSVVDWTDGDEYANICAGRSYTPKRFSGNVVQFLAAGEAHSTLVLDDPRLGWRDSVGERFSVRRVSGRADAIFKQPDVGELAFLFSALLDGVNTEIRQ
jgi:hypothetical protein